MEFSFYSLGLDTRKQSWPRTKLGKIVRMLRSHCIRLDIPAVPLLVQWSSPTCSFWQLKYMLCCLLKRLHWIFAAVYFRSNPTSPSSLNPRVTVHVTPFYIAIEFSESFPSISKRAIEFGYDRHINNSRYDYAGKLLAIVSVAR